MANKKEINAEIPAFSYMLRSLRAGLDTQVQSTRKRNRYPDQAETANRIGISSATYRALESGCPVNPTLVTLLRIKKFYRISDEEFGRLVLTINTE